MNLTPQQIKEYIASVPSQTSDRLSHIYKCFLTTSTTSELKAIEPLLTAILKELRSRHKPLPKETPLDEQLTKNPDQDTDS